MKHTRFWRFALAGILLALCVAGYNGYRWSVAATAGEALLPQSRIMLSVGIIVVLALAVWWQYKRWTKAQEEINSMERLTLLIEPSGRDEYQNSTFWHDLIGQIKRDRNIPCDHMTLEMVVHNGVIRFYFHIEASKQTLNILSAEVRKAWPKTHVEIISDHPLNLSKPSNRSESSKLSEQEEVQITWRELSLSRDDKYPISLPNRKDFSAPRNALHRDQVADYLAALSTIKRGTAGIQILVRPAPEASRDKWKQDANSMRKKLQTKHTHVREYGHREQRKTFGVHNEDELKRDVQTLSERLDDTMIEVVFRVWSDLTEEGTTAQLSGQIVAASAGGRNSFKGKKIEAAGKEEQLKGMHFPIIGGAIMTSTELDRMVQIPGEATCQQFPMIGTAGAERLPVVEELVVPPFQTLCVPSGLQIGRYRPTVARSTTYRAYGLGTSTTAETVMVGHSFVAAREHTFIFGPTGTGKSTLAENILLQDWLGGEGHSVLVIDPHGELIHSILQAVPRSREGDVVIINPNDIQPPRINVMNMTNAEKSGEGGIDKGIAHMLEGFKYAMGASWATSVGMQDVLLQGMAMVKSLDLDASMCELEEFLGLVSGSGKENEERRRKQLSDYGRLPLDVAGERALTYWRKEFMALDTRARAQSAGAAKRRVKAFLNSDDIRSTMGMKGSTIDLEEAVNSGKLVLVVMAEGMGEIDKKIWGALLVREFISILKRRSRSQRTRHASIVIDEMASTIGTMKEFVKEIGAELRKFGGSATLITQSYSQIPDDTIDEIKANYRTQIAFSGSPEDAAIASGLFQGKVTAEDVQALPRYHAYLLASVKGAQAPPCLVECFPPAMPPSLPTKSVWPFHPTWSYITEHAEYAGPSDDLDEMLWLKQLELATGRRTKSNVMQIVGEILKNKQGHKQGWEKLEKIYALKKQYDRWRWGVLLKEPGIIQDTASRIEMLSRLRYGIPFWWSLAEYRYRYLGDEDPLSVDVPDGKETPPHTVKRVQALKFEQGEPGPHADLF